MYGSQAQYSSSPFPVRFEKDVNMYGSQARDDEHNKKIRFEKDVNMYGSQAILELIKE